MESRSEELRRELVYWKRIPEAARPSLRALARELGTSHQLLAFYLKDLENWEARPLFRQARAISRSATAEGRALTPEEEEQIYRLKRDGGRIMVGPALLKSFQKIKQEAETGPLHRAQFKMLEIYARMQMPGASELLKRRREIGVKKRKSFPNVVRKTPRKEGESLICWVRRIFDECEKYETQYPSVIPVELLQKYSETERRSDEINLPVASDDAAKSFRSE